MEAKLGEPSRAYRDDHRDQVPPEFENAFEAMHKSLLTFSNYVDAANVVRRKVPLSAKRDEEALDAYRKLMN